MTMAPWEIKTALTFRLVSLAAFFRGGREADFVLFKTLFIFASKTISLTVR